MTDNKISILSPESENPEDQRHPLMSWSTKTIDQPTSARRLAIIVGLLPAIAITLFALWPLYNGMTVDFERRIEMVPSGLIAGLIMTTICRQKTVFNYRIYPDHGEHEHYLYYPEYAGKLFTGIVIACILILAGVAIYTSSWLILIFGPIVILMGSGGSLLNFEQPEPLLVPSLPWKDHLAVTVDRKYRIVVTHLDNPTLGFVARFPNKALMEQYMDFLRTVLPGTVQYTEEVWKW